MSKAWHRTLGGLLAIALAITAVAVLLVLNHGGEQAYGGPVIDFSIGIDADGDTTLDCTTKAAGPSKCTLDPGSTFNLRVTLNSNGGLEYDGWEGFFTYAGVTPTEAFDANAWPGCSGPPAGFPVFDHNPGDSEVAAGCAAGIGASSSTYTGPLATIGFTCDASGSIIMRHGDGESSLVTVTMGSVSETNPTETLTINCGAEPPTPTQTPTPEATPTPCPPEGCPTPTPTNTPLPATATPTRTNTPTATNTPAKECGDVNDMGGVTSIDALLVLQVAAGLFDADGLPNPGSADVNGDGLINAIDAALILQRDANLTGPLQGC